MTIALDRGRQIPEGMTVKEFAEREATSLRSLYPALWGRLVEWAAVRNGDVLETFEFFLADAFDKLSYAVGDPIPYDLREDYPAHEWFTYNYVAGAIRQNNFLHPARQYALTGGGLQSAENGAYIVYAEPIKQAVMDNGRITGWVSVNRYGASVLNAQTMLIVDVDTYADPEEFNKCVLMPDRDIALSVLSEVRRKHLPHESFRIFSTRAGMRYICTSREFSPSEADYLQQLMLADPLYRNLCVKQNCYRARLTPKPWRSGTTVCTEYDGLGIGTVLPQFEELLSIHDTCIEDEYTAGELA